MGLIVRLVMFQPDIAANLGAAMRLCSCLQIGLDIIEPCGFPMSDKTLRRAAMDYGARCEAVRHDDWTQFLATRHARGGRLVLLETDGDAALGDFVFAPGDALVVGRETAGTPDHVRTACAASVRIPMAAGARSLNVVTASAVALAIALDRLDAWPG
jgi:tRNA (cytidine/uridine-2'-O-)-methyltransferase